LGLQPGSSGAVPLDVAASLFGADLRQPGPLGSERCQFTARRIEPSAPVPAGLSTLPEVGIRFAARPSPDNHTEFAVPVGALANFGSLHWLVTVGVVIQLAHPESKRRK
jgi:hypothetical protein